MAGLWLGGFTDGEDVPVRSAEVALARTADQIRELDHQLRRLALLNQAMWELIRTRAQLTDQDLEDMAREIDLRDGVQDDMISQTALRCPSCNRVSNSKHYKCLYCGQLFEKPLFG